MNKNKAIVTNLREDTIYGACQYCGQMVALPEREYFSDAEQTESATYHCNCPEAGKYKYEKDAAMDREYAIERASDHIETVYGSGAEAYGLDSVDEIVKALMLTAATMVYDKKIVAITINVDPELKVKISKSAKEKLVFTRSDAAVIKREI
jgi:hypothetical protein